MQGEQMVKMHPWSACAPVRLPRRRGGSLFFDNLNQSNQHSAVGIQPLNSMSIVWESNQKDQTLDKAKD